MDFSREEGGRAAPFAVVDRERRVSLGAESSSSGGGSEGRSSLEEESVAAVTQGSFDVSLKTMDLEPTTIPSSSLAPAPSKGNSSLRKRPSALALQGSNGSSRRRLSSASSSTGSTSVAGTAQDVEEIKSPMDVDFPSSEQPSLPPQQPHTILSLPPGKKGSNSRARPMALNLASTIAPETNVASAPASDSSINAKSFVVPKTLLLPVGSASLGPPSALELDATLVDSGKAVWKGDDEKRGDNNEGKSTEAVSLAAEMDVDHLPTTSPSSTLTLPSVTKLSPAPSPSKRGLKARPSALSLFSTSPIHPDSAPTSQLDLTPSPPNASIPLLLLPEGDSVSTSPSSSASSATSSNPPRSLLSLPPKPLSSSLRVKPSPLALNFSNSSTSLSVNRPNLHISPSAPNLRQASTAALTPSESWATAPPPPSSIGKGKRNAKGLSLSLGFGSASPGSSSSESGAPSSPGPSTTNTGGARFNMRPPHTSIPPQTPSSSAHFQTSFPQGPPSSSYSSSSQNIPPGQRPNLLALLPTNERDPSDHASFSNPANRPYADGPIEILPGLFIGSEENARDWQTLTSSKYNIGRVVNVAKELVGAGDEYGTADEDQALNQLRPAVSTPNLRVASAGGVGAGAKVQEKKYTLPNGRKMEYLHLPWSHGQADLVSGGEGGESGFTRAGEWVGEGLVRGEGVLVHCQCGISRSATLVIAIVMRLAAEGNMVEELGEVRGMHDAYEFVKKKSPWIGPNVSLIYQLLEWERLLAAQTSHLPQIISSNNSSDGSSVSTPMHRGFSTEVESEEDWSRRRAELEALEEAEELDRDMEERMKRSRTTSASSTVSSSSSGGAGPASVGAGGRKPFGIKRRISGSSLASEITLEEEDETGEEEGSDTSETRTPPPPLPHSDSDAMMVDGIVEDTTGGRSTEDMEVAGVSQKPTKFAAPPVGGRAERKRSSTLSFVPSLDPLPSSPTTITDPSPSILSEASATLDPLTSRISLLPRSKSYQSHAQRASLSSLDETTPSSPLISSFTSTTFNQAPGFAPTAFDQAPARSETPSSMTSTSSRRSSLSSFPRPPPILSSTNEPRSLQQLLFFPASPNRSMDPSTPTMAHSTSIFLSSPAPTQQTFASSSSSFGYQLASTSPITERTPTGVQRLRSMIPPIISPTTSSALLMDDTPLAHVFGSLGGGLGGGGFGSRHSPRQRKDLHRKTFSLDVKSLFSSSSPSSANPSDPLPPSADAAGPSFSPPKRTRAPSAGILGGFVFGGGGGGGRHSRTPSISSVTSSQGGGGGGSTTSSRRSSVNGGGMMPTPSTPTCVVTEFNARGFVLDTREMK